MIRSSSLDFIDFISEALFDKKKKKKSSNIKKKKKKKCPVLSIKKWRKKSEFTENKNI